MFENLLVHHDLLFAPRLVEPLIRPPVTRLAAAAAEPIARFPPQTPAASLSRPRSLPLLCGFELGLTPSPGPARRTRVLVDLRRPVDGCPRAARAVADRTAFGCLSTSPGVSGSGTSIMSGSNRTSVVLENADRTRGTTVRAPQGTPSRSPVTPLDRCNRRRKAAIPRSHLIRLAGHRECSSLRTRSKVATPPGSSTRQASTLSL